MSKVYSFGAGQNGKLGHGTFDSEFVPRQITKLNGLNIKQIAAGSWSSMVLLEDGRLYSFGLNKNGMLAQNPSADPFLCAPKLVPPFSSEVVKVALGGFHSLFLTKTGQVYGSGSNMQGQIGYNDVPYCNSPVLVAEYALDVITGWKTSAYIQKDGKLFMFGANGCGQCGVGSFRDVITPTQVQFPNGSERVTQASIGQLHTLLITAQSKLYGMGCGANGRLGSINRDFVTSPSEIQFFQGKSVHQISCGYTHSIVLLKDGSVYTFGSGLEGATGMGNYDDAYVPQQILHSLPISKISAGGFHSLFLTKTGELYACGLNWGQLGVGKKYDSKVYPHINIPVRVDLHDTRIRDFSAGGGSHTLVLIGKNYIEQFFFILQTNPSFKDVQFKF